MKILTDIDTLKKNGWTRDPLSQDEDPIYRKELDKGIYLSAWKEDSSDENCRMWKCYYSYRMEGVETPDDLIKIAQEFKALEEEIEDDDDEEYGLFYTK